MKCYSCGGEVNLTDKVCPFCGRPLTETAGYRADEAKYANRSEKTKSKVGGIISDNIPIVISVAIMIVLIIALSIASYVKNNAYTFKGDAKRKEAVNMYDSYSAEIQSYLDAGDYTGFAAFKEYHNIAEWEEPYDDLNTLWMIAEEYVSLVSTVEASTMFGPEAEIYRPEQDVDDCYFAINDFYREFEYDLEDIEEDTYKEYIYDMKDKAGIILEVYLGLDEKGLEEYLASSDAKKKAYLEEVLLND